MRHFWLALSLLASVALAHAAPVPVATNAPDRDEAAVVELEELWRRGGEDDLDVLFGVPRQVVRDRDGRVLVLDDQLCQVHTFSADGEFLGSLGREGEGPGEFRRPTGVVTLPDGRLAVAKLLSAELERLEPDGTPAGRLVLGGDGPRDGVTVLYGVTLRGGTLLAAQTRSALDQSTGQMDRVQTLDAFTTSGERRARICEARIALDFTGTRPVVESELLRSFLMVSAVGPDGRIYVPHTRDEYAIDVFTPDGRRVMTIERPDYRAPERTDRERRRMEALADTWVRNSGIEFPFDYAEHEMCIRGLFLDDRGHLFVRHAASHRDLPAGVFLRLDEYAPDGAWLGEVEVRGVGDPWLDTMFWLGDGRVAIMRGGALTELERWRDAAVLWDDEAEVVPELVVCRWSH
jgi:hypothetical protein